MGYLIHDCETSIKKSFKRKANPFDSENYVVANGFKRKDSMIFCDYHLSPGQQRIPIREDDTVLVGFNYKFDMLWHWHLKELQDFFKRGGRVWCCQYAEYLLEGQDTHAQMCSMDSIVEKYGGVLKIDEVKAMWNAGIDTPDIPKDLLLKYLGGKDGDIANTERIFLGQVKRAKQQNQLVDIMQRMEGLLCTTEMEYNGLFINKAVAYEDKAMLETELLNIDGELTTALPNLPPELEFNFNSPVHKSCLLFGGVAKYEKWEQHLDELGRPVYSKSDVEYVLQDGLPRMTLQRFLQQSYVSKMLFGETCVADTFKGGKRKGELKTKKLKRFDLSKPKGKIRDFGFEFTRITEPSSEWKGKNTDFLGNPLYSTDKDIIEELGTRGIPFLNALANRSKIIKDLGTYYETEDANGNKKGMLTYVDKDNIIHHKLNHNLTITSRLSSSDPNLQNITRADWDETLGRAKSVVKRMFSSRFGDDGEMTEADYSQLEVVVQGLLTGDMQLTADLKAKVDFHCKRLAAKEDMAYEDVFELCKIKKLAEWCLKRTKTKEFTFQRAFGAALKSIAAKTGMALKDVEKLSEAEEKLYPGIKKFYDEVESIAAASRVPTNVKLPLPDNNTVYIPVGKGFYMTPMRGRYTFYEQPAPKFLRNKGIMTCLYRPHIQNYPIQGTAAQLVQYILGLLFRHFKRNNNYGGLAYLVNTVHDCVWVDHHKSIRDIVRADIKRIMQMIPQLLKKLHNIDTELEFPVEVETGINMMELHK